MKKPTKKVKEPVLEVPNIARIQPLTLRLDREDLNTVVDKINEIIAEINK